MGLCADRALQFCGSDTDAFGKLFLVQAADRMLDDQKLWIRLAGLSLCAHQRQEGFGDDNVGFNAQCFEFDTVMDTPRRARPSIG